MATQASPPLPAIYAHWYHRRLSSSPDVPCRDDAQMAPPWTRKTTGVSRRGAPIHRQGTFLRITRNDTPRPRHGQTEHKSMNNNAFRSALDLTRSAVCSGTPSMLSFLEGSPVVPAERPPPRSSMLFDNRNEATRTAAGVPLLGIPINDPACGTKPSGKVLPAADRGSPTGSLLNEATDCPAYHLTA